MKKLTAYRKSNNLFNWFMIFTGLNFMLVWLPLLRCLFDGKSYSWGTSYFGVDFFSKGIQTDYFILIPLLFFFIVFYISFYWIKNRRVLYLMLILWWIYSSGNQLYSLLKNGDMMFHGDTLNINVSLSYIIVPIAIISLIWITLIILKDKKLPEQRLPWTKRNKNRALMILSPLVIQAILYSIGEPHGTTDIIAVVITIIQSFLIPTLFIPLKLKGGNLNS